MVKHIVLMKPKATTTETDKERLLAALKGMRGRIPGIVDLQAGESFTERHKGYTIALVVRLQDRAALEAYGPHPVHVPVKALVQELCEDVLAHDFEF